VTIRLAPDLATMRRLAAVAQGQEPADVLLVGGVLVNALDRLQELGEGRRLGLEILD
jgi:hypothetical protein